MQPSSVFTTASSRLHADLIVIRLKRAGIDCSKISVIAPKRSAPYAMMCWLRGHLRALKFNGDQVTAAGSWKELDLSSESALVRSLHRAGLGMQDAHTFAERMARGEIIIRVRSENADEIAIAWHTCRELGAEEIAFGTAPTPQKRRAEPRRRMSPRLLSSSAMSAAM